MPDTIKHSYSPPLTHFPGRGRGRGEGGRGKGKGNGREGEAEGEGNISVPLYASALVSWSHNR